MSLLHQRTSILFLVVALLLSLLLTGCAGSVANEASAPAETDLFAYPSAAGSINHGIEARGYPASTPAATEVMREDAVAGGVAGAAESVFDETQEALGDVVAEPESAAPAAAATPVAANVPFRQDPERKIIKNADLTLEVESVQISLSRIGNAAAEVGGYVLETRTNFGEEGAEGAVIRIAVPVERFEDTLERIREQATRLIDEQATGTDVTQEYVDTQSQITNLEATQARIREFLDQATSVEEALRINQQLSEVEAQLSQLKGRLQYLAQRAAFSTIMVQLIQQPPEITPTPTATPTPTVTPTPAPIWSPGETAGEAYGTLSTIMQSLATVAIWIVVVGLPLALPIALVWMVIRARLQRRQRQQKPTPPVGPPAQGPVESGQS